MAANRINFYRKYIKNVGKSFGYAAMDILKEYNPIVSDVFSSTKGAVTSTYNTIKDFAFSSHSESEKSLLGELKDAGTGAFKNLMDDIKTGNWYNKARDDAADADMMKALGFDMSDFDFDFDFDADSWGEGDDSFTATAQSEMENDKKNTAATIMSMNIVGNRVANAVNEGTVRSANYISNTIRESNKAIYDLNQRGFSQTLLGINTVNSTLSEFANKLGTPLTAHMQNATVFYTKTTEQLNKIEQHLATIAQNTTPAKVVGERNYTGKKKPGIEDMLSSSGLDLNQYFEFVKTSMADYKDTADMIINFAKGTLGIGSGSKNSNISLGKSILTGGLKAMIPEMFKRSMEEFNKSLGDVLAGALVKASRTSPSSIGMDILKDLLVPTNYFKKGIDTSNYEKGAVAWDGKARKALVEVIPTTLFKILGALTGKEQRYDYNTGKFVDVKTIKTQQEEMLKKNARTAGGDFRSKARELARERAGGNKALEDKYYQEIENYFYNAYATDYGYKNFDKIGKSDFKKDKFGIESDEVLRILRAVVASGQANSYFRTNATTRAAQRRELLEAEKAGDYIFNALSDGSLLTEKAGKNGSKIFAKGTLGFYVKGIFEHTGYIASNLTKVGSYGTGGGTNTGSPQKFTKFGDFDPAMNKHDLAQKQSKKDKNKRKAEKAAQSGELHRDDANRILGLSDFATEEEYEKYRREQQEKEGKKKLTDAQQNIKDKISGMFKGLPRSFKNVFDAPFNAAAKLLDSLSTSFNTFLWGDPTGSDKGFFGAMKDKLSDMFKSVTDSFKDDTKDWFHKAFEGIFGVKGEDGKRHGGFFGTGFGQDIKAELNNAKGWLSNTGLEILYGTKYAEAYKKNKQAKQQQTSRPGSNPDSNDYIPGLAYLNAARGRKVTKSGIVSVSEGEMIIPSDYNPYYHGTNDKRTQTRRELDNTRRFFSGKGGVGRVTYFGNYAPGGTVGDQKQTVVIDGVTRVVGQTFRSSKDDKFYVADASGKAVPVKVSKSGMKSEDGVLKKKVGDEFVEVNGLFGAIHGAQHLAGDFYNEMKDRFDLSGDNKEARKKAKEKDKKAIMSGLSALGKEAKTNRGAIGAGALIGAGASILTGGVIGPLMGASIGAAAGLTMRSEVVQKFLFGEVDENGNEVSKGVFSHKFGENLKKFVPSMAKGGAVGTIGGLFMGSPILGAIVGSSIGYVSKSEKAQKVLFGDIDNPTALGKLRDKIKERIPGITLGAIGGLLAGPFGITGNLLLGSGIGFLASSEKVKDFFLGKKGSNGKRAGGFLYDFKHKVMDNVSELFHNIGNSVKGFGKKLLRRVGRHTKNLMSSIAKGIAKAAAKTKTGSRVINFMKGIPGAATDILGRTVGVFSRRRQRKNLSKGYDVWDKREGRNLTASERMALREERGYNVNNSVSNFDKMLMNVKSEEDLNKINDTINTLINPEQTSKQMRNDSMTMLYNGLSDNVDATKVAKLMKDGRIEEAKNLITSQGGTDADIELLTKARTKFEDADKQNNNAKDTLRHWAQNYGIDFTGRKIDELANIQDLIKTERGRFKSEKEKEENQPGTYRFRVIHALESIAENVAKQAEDLGVDDVNVPDSIKNEEGKIKTRDEKEKERDRFRDFVKVTEGRYDKEKFKEQAEDMQGTAEEGGEYYDDDRYQQRMNKIREKYSGEIGNYGFFHRLRRNINKGGETFGANAGYAFRKTGKKLSSGLGALKSGLFTSKEKLWLGKERRDRENKLTDLKLDAEEEIAAGNGKKIAILDGQEMTYNEIYERLKDYEGESTGKYLGKAALYGLRDAGLLAASPILLPGALAVKAGKRIARGVGNLIEQHREDKMNMATIAKRMIDRNLGNTKTYFAGQLRTYNEIYKMLGYEGALSDEHVNGYNEEQQPTGEPVPDYAFGTPFARRGLASVSEGETILPANYFGNYAAGGVANGLMPLLSMMYGLGVRGLNFGKKAIGFGINAGKNVSDFIRSNFGTGGLNDNEFIGADAKPGKVGAGDEDAEKAFVSHVDFMGGVHQYERTPQGELKEQTNDRETDAARAKMDNLYDAITGGAKLSAAQLALMGASAGISANDLQKLTGLGGGSNDSGGSGLLSSLKNILSIIPGAGIAFGIGGLASKGVKAIKNKLLYGTWSKPTGIGNKIDAIKTKWSPSYRHNVIRDNLYKTFYQNYNDPQLRYYKDIMEQKLNNFNALDYLDDATLAKYNIVWDDEAQCFVDLNTGKTYQSGYIDDVGNIHGYNIDDEANIVDDIIGKADDIDIPGATNNIDDIVRDANKIDDSPVDEIASHADDWNSKSAADKIKDVSKDANHLDDSPFDEIATHGDDIKGSTTIHSSAADDASHNMEGYNEWKNKSTAEKIDDISHLDDTPIDEIASATKTGSITTVNNIKKQPVNDIMKRIEAFDPELTNGYKPFVQDGTLDYKANNNIVDNVVGETKWTKFKSFIKGQVVTAAIIVAICIAVALLGVILSSNWYKSAEETEAFVKDELQKTCNAGYQYYFESPKEFKDYVSKRPNTAGYWFTNHPVGAIIHIKGSKDTNSKDNVSIYPYMIYAPAANTLWTVMKYEQYKFRGSYDKRFYDGSSKFQVSKESTSSYAFFGRTRLNSYSLFMVHNYKYFRSYSVSPASYTDSMKMVFDSGFGGQFKKATIDALGSSCIEAASLGFVSQGDFEGKLVNWINYEYESNIYRNETKQGELIDFNDAFFSPMQIAKPDIDDYSNSQLDYLGGMIDEGAAHESGSNKVVNTDATDYGYTKPDYDKIMKNEADQLIQYVQHTPGDFYDCYGIPLSLGEVQDAAYSGGINYEADTSKFDWLHKTYEKIIGPYLGPGYEALSGGNSGLNHKYRKSGAGSFISQYDNGYKNIAYGKSNIGDIGCAPAAATNLISALGGKLSMKDAINVGKKYTNENGTQIDYFSDIFAKSGLKTDNLNSDKEITDSLINNKPVVLLGQDETNDSKENSSFGPNSHYVVGTGLNPDGTVNVLDSENDGPKSYDLRKILDGTFAAITASLSGGASGIGDRSYAAEQAKHEAEQRAQYEKDQKKKANDNMGAHSSAADAAEAEGKAYQDWLDNKSTSEYKYTGITGLLSYLQNKVGRAFGDVRFSDTLSHDSTYRSSGSALTNALYSSSYVPSGGSNNTKQAELVAYAKDRLNKEAYDQGRREELVNDPNVLPGIDRFSDCSSFARRAYKTVFGEDIGSYTGAQISKLRDGSGPNVIVDESTNSRRPFTSFAQPGDLVYFNGGTKDSSVNHVEMYVGDNKFIGQDASGPNKFYSKYYFADRSEKGYKSASGPSLKEDAYNYRRNSDKDKYMLTARFKDIAKYGTSVGRSYAAEQANAEGRQRSLWEASQKSADQMSRDEVRQAVWNYFKMQGYSDQATAAIMGNIQQESDFDSTNVTVEPNAAKNWAAGLFQWHDKRSYDNGNYTYVDSNGKTQTQDPQRYGALMELAKARGLDWTNPVLQMEFAESELMNLNERWMNLNKETKDNELRKASENNFYKRGLTKNDSVRPADFKYLTNLEKATMIFDAGFERSKGDSSSNEKRIKYAKENYARFAGSGSGLVGGRSYASEEAEKSGEKYNKWLKSQKYGPEQTPTAATQKMFDMINTAKALNNKEQYSMNTELRGGMHNGYFYSDCSEFASRMYDQAGITSKLKGKNTTEQVIAIRKGQIPGLKMVIWDPTGENRIPYLKELRVGDLLYFKTRGYRNDRMGGANEHGNVSHVELYAGNGYITGQDALGPNIDPKELTTDGKGLQGSGPTYRSLDSIRPEGYIEMFSNADYSSGSRKENQPLYDRFIGAARWVGNESGGKSALLSFKKHIINPGKLSTGRKSKGKNLYGGASSILDENYITNDTKKILNNLQTAIVAKGERGEMSQGIVNQLLLAIIEILRMIATNTSSVGGIYSELSNLNLGNLLTSGSGSNTATTRKDGTKKNNNYHRNGKFISASSFEPSAALKTLVNGLANFAKG